MKGLRFGDQSYGEHSFERSGGGIHRIVMVLGGQFRMLGLGKQCRRLGEWHCALLQGKCYLFFP